MARLKFEAFPQDLTSLYELAYKLGDDSPLRRILFLARELGCQTIVYQKPSLHLGFKSEWEDYYRYMHPCPKKTTEKLNFFAKPIHTTSDLGNVKPGDFLGYVYLRPLPTQRVCEAVLRIPKDSTGNYTLAKGKYATYVGKYRFEVEGVPFVQQDCNAGVCAHASLITISQIIPHIFPTSPVKPWTVGEIKRCVNQMPSANIGLGLQLAHVSRVFTEMGLSGDTVYMFPRDQTRLFQPEQIIYMYMESRLPVFVGLPLEARGTGHSIVVCGHAFNKQAWWPEAWPEYYTTIPSGESWLSSVSWINEWIICDDNFGPYLAMPKHLCDVSWIAVPLPRNILMKGDTASLNAFWIVRAPIFRSIMNAAKQQSCSPWIDPFIKHLSGGKLVLRMFLTTPAELQESVRRDNTMNKELAQYYLNYDLPNYFWLGELSIPELFREGSRLGEVLINASYPQKFIKTGHEALISTHAPGAVLTYDNKMHRPMPYLVPNDCPSRVLTR